MIRVRTWTRWVLLGDDASWGATLATGRVAIMVLAVLALLLHALDLATGIRMMLVYGVQLEQNPLARAIMTDAGPLGLAGAKFLVVGAGVLLFVRTAQLGRPRLARNCLLIAAGIGLLGFTSNLVG
jgi:hypothetical protein